MKLPCPVPGCDQEAPLRTVTHLLAHLVGAHGKSAEEAFPLALGPLDLRLDQLDRELELGRIRAAKKTPPGPPGKPLPLPERPGHYWRCGTCGKGDWSGPFASAQDLRARVERHVGRNPGHGVVTEERRP